MKNSVLLGLFMIISALIIFLLITVIILPDENPVTKKTYNSNTMQSFEVYEKPSHNPIIRVSKKTVDNFDAYYNKIDTIIFNEKEKIEIVERIEVDDTGWINETIID